MTNIQNGQTIQTHGLTLRSQHLNGQVGIPTPTPPQDLTAPVIHVHLRGFSPHLWNNPFEVPQPLLDAIEGFGGHVVEFSGHTTLPVIFNPVPRSVYLDHRLEVQLGSSPILQDLPEAHVVVGLLRDEDTGRLSWHLPEDGDNNVILRPLGARNIQDYTYTPDFPANQVYQGQVNFISIPKKVVETWENENRPYALRYFDQSKFGQEKPEEVESKVSWDNSRKGLLLIHGTFTTAGFTWTDREEMLPHLKQLHENYGSRMLAFDHKTLQHSVEENVKRLARRMKDFEVGKVDVLCHSRGGLVARELARRHPELVGKIVQLGTANYGTPLTRPEHMRRYVNHLTNLLLTPVQVSGVLPAHAQMLLKGVLSLLVNVASRTLASLPGLQNQNPDSPWLQALNEEPAPLQLYGVAANYEPVQDEEGHNILWEMAKDAVMDGAFDNEHNDLVVPTVGCFAGTGRFNVPEDHRQQFDAHQGYHHSNFFLKDEVWAFILKHLDGH